MFTQSKLSIAAPTCTHGRFLRFAPNLNSQLSSDRPASVAMTEPRPTFSESWHRVAQLRLGLRSSIVTHRQRFRGEPWIVVQNHFTNEFFRLRPAAWEFVARLEGRTVDEASQPDRRMRSRAAPADGPSGSPESQKAIRRKSTWRNGPGQNRR
jgi:hypothetical protein